MLKLKTDDLFDEATASSGADDASRAASWLHSRYSEPSWIVSDSHDASRTRVLDFRQRLSDGRCLTEVPCLYATVKEYAWWVRNPRFSRIDDAVTHVTMVRNLLNIAHALTIRNIWSFGLVGPYDIDELVEDCRYGADAVLNAADRVERYLSVLAEKNEAEPMPFGGLPRYRSPSGKYDGTVSSTEILTACGLPDSAVGFPRVAWHIARAAVKYGLTPRSAPSEELPDLNNITVQALQRWLDPIESLFVMRRHLRAKGLTFKPFARGAAKVAAQKGHGVARTPIPPPKLALHLMEQATHWVVDYSAPLLDALTEMRMIDDTPSSSAAKRRSIIERLPQAGGLGCPWPIEGGARTNGEALTFVQSIKFLASAAWILIASFSARRYEEIIELEDDCLWGTDSDGWWLNVYIEKTLQRKELVPVPHAVARAVEVLRVLSKEARERTGVASLFQWVNPFTEHESGVVHKLEPRGHLDAFAAHVGVPLHRAGVGKPEVAWHWSPHQFRRFFAVLYFYRYEGATLEALSHQLRHFDIEMTRRYVTQDKDVASIFTDTQWGFAGDLAREIVLGARAVGGGMGEQLKKTSKRLIDMMRRTVHVATPERVASTLRLVMQRKGLVLTPKAWVVCACPRTKEAASRARCRSGQTLTTSDVGPSFENAGPLVCPHCPYSIADKGRQPFVDRQADHLEAAEASGARIGTLFGELEAAQLVEIRNARDKSYVGAAPLPEALSEAEGAE